MPEKHGIPACAGMTNWDLFSASLSRTSRNQNVGWIKRVARIHQSAWTIHWWKRYAFSTLHKPTWKATPVLDSRCILVTNCEDLTGKRLSRTSRNQKWG